MSVAADLRSEKLRSRVPSSRSWTRRWRPSFGGASVPSSTRGCILRRVSSRIRSRARGRLSPAGLDTRSRKAEPRDAEEPDDPGPPWLDLEDGAHEGSTLHRPADVDEAPASEGGVPSSDEWSVVDERREAVRGDEPLLVDDYIVTTPEQTPAEEDQPTSHYPILPAPNPTPRQSTLPTLPFDGSASA